MGDHTEEEECALTALRPVFKGMDAVNDATEMLQSSLADVLAAVMDIAAAERERIAARCQAWAVAQFDARGPHDARGATLWDVSTWLREGHADEVPDLPFSPGSPGAGHV